MSASQHFLESLHWQPDGWPKYRAEQVRRWIFQRGEASPDAMTDLSKELRAEMKKTWTWDLPTIKERLDSADGSSKLLVRLASGHMIETVILRYDDRVSVCLSSQVGCKLACTFCQTGKLGFIRHLSASEILGQAWLARSIVASEGRRLSHVVFMGMGEPLDNYDSVVRAVNTLVSPEGFGLSRRHVTVSTSGIVPKIRSLATDAKCALAVSLHAATDELRTELMPINRRYDLAELKLVLREYQEITAQKITFEYILIRNKNCDAKAARDLVRFLQGLRCKVNLIPFNDHPGLPYQRPSDAEIRAFQLELARRSIPAPVRYSKGSDVSAACGQLAAKVAADLAAIPSRKSLISKNDPANLTNSPY